MTFCKKKNNHMKKNDYYHYPAVFTYEQGKDIAVVFPDFDVGTYGKTEKDAFAMAKELLGCVIFGLEDDGESIPPATPIKDIVTGDNECAVSIEVFIPSYRK